MSVAYLFPGQGSQYTGMDQAGGGLDMATLYEADEVLKEPLSALLKNGHEELLARTENTQPAILTVSVALARRLKRERPDLSPVALTGHSLGEYSALVVAEALDFADAVRLVRLRGQAMQRAVPVGVGAMAAVMGVDRELLNGLIEEAARAEDGSREILSLSALNGPAQVVVAGHSTAIDRLILRVEALGGACKRLVVSAPFHCPLMEPAALELQNALSNITIRQPRYPVVQNARAKVATDPEEIRSFLIAQVVEPVFWEACVQQLKNLGADRCIEIGPSKTLAGLVKRIDRGLKTISLDSPSSWESL
jgi:[acyl-carrier-protein] S-malonyltransferase